MLWQRIIVVLVVYAVSGIYATAQNNPYKINDELYQIFREAYKKKNTLEGVELAKKMQSRAAKIGDKKAECMSLTIPLLYWYYNMGHTPEFNQALKVLQKKALETGYIQYYYYGTSNKVNFMLNNNTVWAAQRYSMEVQDFALKHNHIYGIYTTLKDIGKIHKRMGDYSKALSSYKEVLEYGKKYLPDQDMASCYYNIGDCYKDMRQYDKQLECVESGMKVAKTERSRLNLLVLKANALFNLNREEEFMEVIRKMGIDKMSEEEMLRGDMWELKVMEYIHDKRWKDAERYIGQFNKFTFTKYQYYVMLYERMGDYKKVFGSQMTYDLLRDSLNQKMKSVDMMEMLEQQDEGMREIDRQKKAVLNTKLRLSNTELMIYNSSLELDHSRSAERMAKLNLENALLSLNNKKLEANRLRDSLRMHEIVKKEKETEMRNNKLTFNVTASVSLVLILTLLIYSYNRKKLAKHLEDTNDELEMNVEQLKIARDQADNANRMKTMFLQNMSHEIRTPLNAIVGFSQLVSMPGGSFGTEERKDMTKRISDNSDLLLTIINDILDLTTLESGNYQMNLEEVRMNEICRDALDTVMHRKPENVDIRFESDMPDDFMLATDANRVKQVLINFLTNAIKNTSSGEIVLSVWGTKRHGHLQLAVTDTGVGIPEEKMDSIFERFVKLDNFKQGTGLGLSICMAIADRLGGTICIDREYKDGARFIFELGCADDRNTN